MISPHRQKVTLDEFNTFIDQPENADKMFEWVNGEIFEVPTNFNASKIAATILGYIFMYLIKNDIGHVTGADGGYIISGERYAPDVAYISYEKQPDVTTSGYNPNPPDLAVEVISNASSSSEQNKLRLKLTSYLSNGVTVWVVNPETRRVEVHQVGEPAREYDESEILTGGDILPDFTLAVMDIFPKQNKTE